jgi:hypothetical protein
MQPVRGTIRIHGSTGDARQIPPPIHRDRTGQDRVPSVRRVCGYAGRSHALIGAIGLVGVAGACGEGTQPIVDWPLGTLAWRAAPARGSPEVDCSRDSVLIGRGSMIARARASLGRRPTATPSDVARGRPAHHRLAVAVAAWSSSATAARLQCRRAADDLGGHGDHADSCHHNELTEMLLSGPSDAGRRTPASRH